MGYVKVYQYGGVTEVYEYEKDLNTNKRKKHQSSLDKKRAKARRSNNQYIRTKRAISRAKKNFFRLVHVNNKNAKTVHFCTLTLATPASYVVATRFLSRFFTNLSNQNYAVENTEISYIGVPELTQKGAYHFHLLIYNLRPEVTKRERETRNIQRTCWQRGYLQIDLATYTTKGLAGYMAKYMAKYLGNPNNEARRAYNCSRNIEKVRSYGSKTLSSFFDDLIPDQHPERGAQFETPFLGVCQYKRYEVL